MIDFIAHHLDAYHEEVYIKLRDACSRGDHHVAQNILEGLGPETSLIVNATPGGANTLLFSACEDGHEQIVQLLLNYGAEARVNHVTRYSPLYIACYHGRLSIVRLLITKFPSLVNVETVEKWLPVHGAAINNHVKVVQELLEHSYPPEVMLRFLHHTGQYEYDFPYDINAQDATGKTILYIASFLGNLPLVELLLKFRLPGYVVSRNSEQDTGDSPKSTSTKFSPTQSSHSTYTKNPPPGPSRSKDVTSPAFSPSPDLDKDQNCSSHKPIEIAPTFIDIYCNYGSETALQAAIKRRHYSIASLLLQNGADPNLTIRPPSSTDETESSPKFSVSTCLVEASKLRESSLVDLLIRFGARDDNSAALEIASKNKDNHLISKLLSLKSFPDPEFKIYKKAIEFSGFSSSSSNAPTSVTVSSIFPSVPVMINWYGIKFIRQIEKQWLINACISHNIKFKLNNQNQAIVLNAITRLDLSNNNFNTVPLCIFQLPSLRVLNLANNHLVSLPEIEDELPASHSSGGMKKSRSHSSNISKFSQPKCSWFLPCLEELYLQNNRIELLSPCVFELPSLHLLDLSSNRITALPNRLWSAPKLRDLNLSSNLLRELPLKLSPVISSSFKEKPNSDDFLDSFEDSDFQRPLEAFKQKPLQRINLWEKEIPLVSATYIENTDNLSAQNPLNSLNLSHNAFSELPINLSCLAINLSRLNMSHNYLKAVGDVKLYPANLKHLDVSHNQIKEWIIPLESCSDCAKYSICYGFSTSNEPISITKGKNSKKSKYCIHKQHTRLEALKTLIISHNLLTKIMILVDQDFEHLDVESKAQLRYQARTLFPNLSMLDISFNRLAKLTPKISELTHLSVLNISGNPNIHHLPPEMGLASKLWNLSTNGCNLGEPLKTMIDSKKYKTMDIIGYLKSILENSRPYARMKLMLVGVQGIGKTSLLEQLRQEGHGSYRKKPPEHWAKRMGKQNIGIKTPKGVTLSTVGVDVCDWTFEKRVRGQHSFGPVTFRTWDFGGQEEYYATHQYFLSRRSLYLVLWKMIDGEKAIESIHKWLVNIQARAPNAPVIIVGTHQDLMGEYYPRLYSEYLQQIIRDRFINVIDSDKLGLPRVVESIEISIKTRYNIKRLCNLIYDTVFELRSSGSKERLLEQKVPATYIALEEVVSFLANERLSDGKDPILVGDQFKSKVSSEMYRRFGLSFRDAAELRQATAFLHENGVLLHYEDATLKDLYFLDAQWLCDQLANVVTIREINPYARNGIMKTDDLKHLFKTTELSQSDMKFYIINLLNKFEVALTWDSRTLLIPSLLPSENAMLSHGCGVSIPIRTKSWGLRTRYGNSSSETDANAPNSPEKQASPSIITINRPEKAIHRLLLMTYFPSGFWSRLISRVLAEENIEEIVRNFYGIPSEVETDLQNFANGKSEWICWQTGFALKHLGHQVFRVKEITLSIENPLFEYYQQNPFLIKQEGTWIDVEISKSSILEIHFPNNLMQIITSSSNHTLQPNIEYLTKLLSMIVDHIDTLLEDWYPTLGTRFVHTSEGKFLVTRIVPCTKCLLASEESVDSGAIQASGSSENSTPNIAPKVEINSWLESSGGRKSSTSSSLKGRNSNIGSVRSVNSQDSGVDDDGSVSSRNTSLDDAKKSISRVNQLDIPSITGKKRSAIYSFMVEECIMLASQEKTVTCPVHNQLDLKEIAPDIMFLDLSQQYLIKSEWIRRGKMLGRGAFGFVFRASLRKKNSVVLTEVAMKALQPVNPGQGARDSDSAAYKAASHKCDRDPMQFACKAYCIARQEISILLSLRHSNIVPLIGVCTHPLALILQLAPMGALDLMIREYRRSGARMNPHVVQKVIHQVAKALEYLHQQRIIYRDLKSENVLIWEMPKPYSSSKSSSSEMRVEIKLADYGISRAILPTGTKGFAGTEGFMAPEIMRYNGEEEYTEKVDCFSFAMFIYELISLRQPFEGQECVKDNILEGGRPLLTDHDILYPTNFLDLMVLCWSQSPENRPSTSQIVSITSAPEFVHLLDVVILAGNSASLCAGLIPHPEFSFFDVFIGRQGEHLDLLMGNSHTWTEYRSFVGSEGNAAITAICLVRSYLWLADAEAIIHIFTCDTYQEIDSFVINPKDETLVMVKEIEFLDSIECVAILTTSGRIIVCDVNTMTLSEIEMRNSNSLCLTYVNPYIEPDAKTCELWCGQAKGFLTIISVTVDKDRVLTEIVATIDHQLSENLDPNDSSRLDVGKIAAETKYVSTYLFPGSMIYQWDARSRTLLHKLDCSKLLPCSESIISIGIEEEVSLENFQVTSMAVIDQELIVGTAWGCMTIIESSTMRPVTVFRPYEEEIKHILPFKKEEFAFHRKRDSTCSSSISTSSTASDEDKYIVTIGKGFRNLANRFVKDREREVKSHLNELVCILWKSGHWINN